MIRTVLIAGAIAAAALELERLRRELALLERQDRHLELSIRSGDDDARRRVDELVRTLGSINPRVTILERSLGPDALLLAEARLLELGPVREEGKLDLTADTRSRLDPRRWPTLVPWPGATS